MADFTVSLLTVTEGSSRVGYKCREKVRCGQWWDSAKQFCKPQILPL